MRTHLLAGLVLALTLSGCASDDRSTTTTPTNTMTGMMGDNMTHMMKTVEIHLSGSTFVNGTQTLYMGDKVHWVNDDAAPTAHTVTSDATGVFDSSPNCAPQGLPVGVPVGQVCMVEGSTFDYTFAEAGSFPYHCKVHPSMTGTITVLEHPMNATMMHA